MKLILLSLIVFLVSCGIQRSIENDKMMRSKGYDKKRDTADIKPYEYFIYHKGFFPQTGQLNPSQTLSDKISIKGFENADSIPYNRIFEEMNFVLPNKTDSLYYGELRFIRKGGPAILYLGTKYGNNKCDCSCFSTMKKRYKVFLKGSFVFFWNVTVKRNGVEYVLPARKYYLK